ncbi:MAG TPA: 4-hydroxy-tetrahydrodipicolinate synthase [Terriglobales bacterium]|nr:4-hydroxy-tetrahydrodipicolinate synthase [Terriglobales bacterium]
MDFSGIYPALTTPFASDGEVDLQALRQNVSRYNQTAVSGYVVLGSTGESVMLSATEGEAILAAVRDSAAPGKRMIAGTGAESTAETIRKTKKAASLGYEAALVKTPYYYKPFYKAEAMIAHYRAVADSSPIPVLLYNIPQFTGIALETPEILTLSKHPNILGIKDSSGDVRRLSEVVGGAHGEFQVFTGSASVVFPSLMMGARGAILALAAALPEACAALYRLFLQKRLDEARQLQSRLLLASKIIVSEAGIPGVKHAMDLCGYYGGPPRLPLQPVSEGSRKKIGDTLAALETSAARA